jgi:stage II sporulation protein AB (anti-sigma F factor)
MSTSTEQEPAGLMSGELELDARSSSLAAARRYAEAVLARFGVGEEECYDFAFAVNEAVTNAIRHGAPDERGKISLSHVVDGDRLTLSVRDYGKFVFPIPEHDARSDHGRGLALMATLTDQVQVCIEPSGTTVSLSKARV